VTFFGNVRRVFVKFQPYLASRTRAT